MMKNPVRSNSALFVRGAVVTSLMLLNGCASYYTHFASFEGKTSAGEQRKFVVSWESAEYPGWSFSDNKATPITLETQCSKRKLVFTDATHESACTSSGIASCGIKGVDVDDKGRMLDSSREVCATITDASGSKRIVDLQREIHITISCRPDQPVIKEKEPGKQKDINVNYDYLNNSVVHYQILTKKVDRYSLSEKVPVLSKKVCEDESK